MSFLPVDQTAMATVTLTQELTLAKTTPGVLSFVQSTERLLSLASSLVVTNAPEKVSLEFMVKFSTIFPGSMQTHKPVQLVPAALEPVVLELAVLEPELQVQTRARQVRHHIFYFYEVHCIYCILVQAQVDHREVRRSLA